MQTFIKLHFLIILTILSSSILACDEEVDCNKCGEKSEHARNASTNIDRFYNLEDKIVSAYQDNENEEAKLLISEYLKLAEVYRCNWNYGNAIHNSNHILGLIAFKSGKTTQAAKYLIEAGKSPGSPQLDSFGPDFDLAIQLLAANETNAVIQYLQGVKQFWEGNEELIDEWITEIKKGGKPKINKYAQASIFETIIKLFFIVWPIFLSITYWLRIKTSHNKKWSFLLIVTLSGYTALIVGGLTVGTIIMSIVPILSDILIVPVVMTATIATPLLLPLLVIHIIYSFYQRKTQETDG